MFFITAAKIQFSNRMPMYYVIITLIIKLVLSKVLVGDYGLECLNREFNNF